MLIVGEKISNKQNFKLPFLSFQLQYDRRVSVTFQENAWCDETAMTFWIRQQWKPACHADMMPVLDVHRAQNTNEIQKLL